MLVLVRLGLVPDVLKSTTTASGELCAMITLASQTHTSPAVCSALGTFICNYLTVDHFTLYSLSMRLSLSPKFELQKKDQPKSEVIFRLDSAIC